MKYFIWVLLASFTFFDCKSQELIPFRADSLWGYKDGQGNIKIDPQYQYTTSFMKDVAVVLKEGVWGAIDKNNHLIIPFKYQFLKPLDSLEFLFGNRAVYFGEYNMGVITRDNKIKVAPEYRFIIKYNGTYIVTKTEDSLISKSSSGDVRSITIIQGLLDSNGRVIIPCKYNGLERINDSLVIVTKGIEGNSQALFNIEGEQLTGFEYMVFGKFIEGVAKARIADKFGFVYPSGKIAIPIVFEYCEDFSNGYALIKEKDRWGAINKKGKVVIEARFEHQEVTNQLKIRYGK